MGLIPTTLNDFKDWDVYAIADFWVKLADAAGTDAEARAFLIMFEPWAKARLGSSS